MALSANQISLFLVLALLSTSTHARDSQFFNKIPSTTNTNNVVPDNNQPVKDQPDFVPDNENSYGLYGHESGADRTNSPQYTTDSDLPPRKYLPKNYNPVAYVTEPEDLNDSVSFSEEKNYATNPTNYYNGEQNRFYNPQQEEESTYRSYPTTTNDNNYYYHGGSSFNSEPQGLSDTRFNTRETYFHNGGGANGYQPHGMSDTRYLEKGKYFYDINSEKYSSNHPYESLREARPTNEYFGNYVGDREINGEFP